MKANHEKIKRQLAIAKGQIEGINKMVDDDKYCIDISNQILATISLLRNVNKEILTSHLSHCVASSKNKEELDQKIAEINSILDRTI